MPIANQIRWLKGMVPQHFGEEFRLGFGGQSVFYGMQGFFSAELPVVFITVLQDIGCLVDNGYFAGQFRLFPEKPNSDIDGASGQRGVRRSEVIVHLPDQRYIIVWLQMMIQAMEVFSAQQIFEFCFGVGQQFPPPGSFDIYGYPILPYICRCG